MTYVNPKDEGGEHSAVTTPDARGAADAEPAAQAERVESAGVPVAPGPRGEPVASAGSAGRGESGAQTPSTGSAGSGALAAPEASGGDRVLVQAARGRAVGLTGLALLALAGVGLALALPFVLGHTLDAVLRGRPAGGWISLCAAAVAGQTLIGAAADVLAATTTADLTAGLRRRAVRHVLAVGPPAVAEGAGDLVTRLVGNAADAAAAPAAAVALPATVAGPIGGVVALGLIDPWLAVAFLAGAPLLVLVVRTFARASSDSISRYQDAQGRIAARFVDALGGARTIAAVRSWDREEARVLRPLAELGVQGRRMWRVQGRATAQAAVLVPLLQITVLAVGGLRLAQGAISVGDLLAASRYALLAAGIGMVVGQLGGLVRGRAAALRLAAVLAVPAPAHGEGLLPAGGPGTLELRDVTVVRDGARVLDRVNLTVPGGAVVAVVGRTGAGKSVLAALAGRLADPDAGAVFLDGRPLPSLSRAALRDAVSYAFERPVLLGSTVGEAIGFGPRPAPPETAAAAARAAGADTFVRLLPGGYDTPLTAAPLSGGEVQRLGLARAFARPGRLLVLDDATSSLDTVTELHVARALLTSHATRTRLLTTHRAATAARAHTVVWLDAGRVRAVAPHAELWPDPAYRALFAPPEREPDGPAADRTGSHGSGPGAQNPSGAHAGWGATAGDAEPHEGDPHAAGPDGRGPGGPGPGGADTAPRPGGAPRGWPRSPGGAGADRPDAGGAEGAGGRG